MSLLLDRGANALACDTFGHTALHLAARSGAQSEKCVEVLLERDEVKEAIDQQDTNGNTPLILACKHGSPAALRGICDAGADFNLLDGGDISPLALATRRGNAAIVEVLEQRGARPHKHWCATGRKYIPELKSAVVHGLPMPPPKRASADPPKRASADPPKRASADDQPAAPPFKHFDNALFAGTRTDTRTGTVPHSA